jgi:hypothetical protein
MNTPMKEVPVSENLAETLSREMKQPMEIASPDNSQLRRIALPPGWSLHEKDDEKLLSTPRRKPRECQSVGRRELYRLRQTAWFAHE